MASNFERLNKLCSDFSVRKKLLDKPEMKSLEAHLKLKDFNFDFFWNCPPFELRDAILTVEHLIPAIRYKEKLDVEYQLKDLALLSDNLHSNPTNTIVIAGATDFTKPRFLAFSLILLDIFINKKPDCYKWAGLKGGFGSEIDFSEDYLVVDNIAASSSKIKFEKISDLLYSNRTTTFIITAGVNPLKLMAEEVNYSFTSCFYLDEGMHVQY